MIQNPSSKMLRVILIVMGCLFITGCDEPEAPSPSAQPTTHHSPSGQRSPPNQREEQQPEPTPPPGPAPRITPSPTPPPAPRSTPSPTPPPSPQPLCSPQSPFKENETTETSKLIEELQIRKAITSARIEFHKETERDLCEAETSWEDFSQAFWLNRNHQDDGDLDESPPLDEGLKQFRKTLDDLKQKYSAENELILTHERLAQLLEVRERLKSALLTYYNKTRIQFEGFPRLFPSSSFFTEHSLEEGRTFNHVTFGDVYHATTGLYQSLTRIQKDFPFLEELTWFRSFQYTESKIIHLNLKSGTVLLESLTPSMDETDTPSNEGESEGHKDFNFWEKIEAAQLYSWDSNYFNGFLPISEEELASKARQKELKAKNERSKKEEAKMAKRSNLIKLLKLSNKTSDADLQSLVDSLKFRLHPDRFNRFPEAKQAQELETLRVQYGYEGDPSKDRTGRAEGFLALVNGC